MIALSLWEFLTHPAVWIAALPVGFLLLLFTASLLEQHPTHPFVPAKPKLPPSPYGGPPILDYDAQLPDLSQLPDYVRVMSDRAHAMGFVFGGILAHVKAPKVKVLATVWFSPDRRTLVLSGAGTVWGMAHHQTWLYTPLKDGHVLVTTDNNDEGDHSGIYKSKRVLNADFDELHGVHARRMENAAAQLDAWREPDPMSALLGLYDRRVNTMLNRGVANFVDAGGMWWRYTVKGALKVCLGFFTQLAAAIPQFRRVDRKPVGSPKLK